MSISDELTNSMLDSLVSLTSYIPSSALVGQYIGCVMEQIWPRLFPMSIDANSLQRLLIRSAVMVARLITVSWGFTPTAVGNTLASQTKRFLNPKTRQSESTTHLVSSLPIWFPP